MVPLPPQHPLQKPKGRFYLKVKTVRKQGKIKITLLLVNFFPRENIVFFSVNIHIV